ncbi:hypothetical protein MRX96_053709, partial [Rhipicephalus microplus]
MWPPEKRPPDQTAPPSQQPYKKTLLTNASAKVAQSPTETQRISAQKPSTQAPQEQLHILMHEYWDDPDLLLTELEHQLNPIGPPPQYPDYPYVGEENELLDADITPDEV